MCESDESFDVVEGVLLFVSTGEFGAGTPDGFRWDCGILRPKCGEAADAPANPNEFNGPYPLAVGIDRSDDSVGFRPGQGGRRPFR